MQLKIKQENNQPDRRAYEAKLSSLESWSESRGRTWPQSMSDRWGNCNTGSYTNMNTVLGIDKQLAEK